MNLAQRRRLYAARELVEIAVVRAALDALDIALELEHPTISEINEAGDPPTLRRARAVARFATDLRCALVQYCKALDRAFDTVPDDDLPF